MQIRFFSATKEFCSGSGTNIANSSKKDTIYLDNRIENAIFVKPNNNKRRMKRYKVSTILRMLSEDGWMLKTSAEATGNMFIRKGRVR